MSKENTGSQDPIQAAIDNAQRAATSLQQYINAAQVLENYIASLVTGCCPKAVKLRQDSGDNDLEDWEWLIDIIVQEATTGEGTEGSRYIYQIIRGEGGYEADPDLGWAILEEAGRRLLNLPDGQTLLPDGYHYHYSVGLGNAGAVNAWDYMDSLPLYKQEQGCSSSSPTPPVGDLCQRIDDAIGECGGMPRTNQQEISSYLDCLSRYAIGPIATREVRLGKAAFQESSGYRNTSDLISTLIEESGHAWQQESLRDETTGFIAYSDAIAYQNEMEYQVKAYILNLYMAGVITLSNYQFDRLQHNICNETYANPSDSDSAELVLTQGPPLGWINPQIQINGSVLDAWPTNSSNWQDICNYVYRG
jgi:hypothetical protein